MTQFPEDLEIIIYRLLDENWVEKSYSFFDGIYYVTMLKDNKKLRIEYSNKNE